MPRESGTATKKTAMPAEISSFKFFENELSIVFSDIR
jgi:hypothetical protein